MYNDADSTCHGPKIVLFSRQSHTEQLHISSMNKNSPPLSTNKYENSSVSLCPTHSK